jgi:hypothetical protein
MTQLPSTARRRAGLAFALLCSTLVLQMPLGAEAATPSARLELRRASEKVELTRYKGEPLFLDLGIYVAAIGEAFDLRVARTSYTEPVQLTQILSGPGGTTDIVDLPEDMLDGWKGLAGFLELEVKKLDGTTVIDQTSTFCPNGYDRQRLSESGPVQPTFPDSCWSNPFTRGMVWGIDADWAVSATRYEDAPLFLRAGRYTATISVADRYVEVFGLDEATSTASVRLKVRTEQYEDCPKCPGGHEGSPRVAQRTAGEVPLDENPNIDSLPDLAALPAWGITVQQRRTKTFLSFGATVWNSGASPLVVEGFRRSSEDLMDGYQYFYRDGEPVGKAPAGTLAFDARDGHDHWHFQQFAGYSLVAADQTEIVRSKKEAFCLVPTDPIDITIPGAEWQPNQIGFGGSACGQPKSLWIRETLPAGWGDTYFQGIPGQSFNITDLPNGTYYIAVEANVGGQLHEQSADNNLELREIILKGRSGARRVVVPPWNGIETETGIF